MSGAGWSTVAMVLIAIDGHRGQWCALDWIVQKTMTPLHVVQAVCDDLVAHDQLQAQVRDGRQYYGASVAADAETVE